MQAAEKQPSCADRVRAHCDSRMTEIKEMLDVRMGRQPATDDITEDSYWEYGLSFDYVAPDTFKEQEEGYWRYQISWGGPSEEIRFYASPSSRRGWHLHRAEFWFLDWFDGAHITLRGEQLDTAREMFDDFDEIGSVQAELDKASD